MCVCVHVNCVTCISGLAGVTGDERAGHGLAIHRHTQVGVHLDMRENSVIIAVQEAVPKGLGLG